jgi:serine/threonine-protein kinase
MHRALAHRELLSGSDPFVGTVVNGKYEVVALLAAGAMGKVYQATQKALGRSVALKVLRVSCTAGTSIGGQLKKRFLREANILAQIQHPNIVTVFDYGAIERVEGERYFMAMEFLAGETLAQRIARKGHLDVGEAVGLARQLARGLTELHAQGVIHRDLKPANLMITARRDREELLKILDFGIVKLAGGEELTMEGSFVGSPRYASPEQTIGCATDPRTDIYSFGIILYECLSGAVPFHSSSLSELLTAHMTEPPEPLGRRAQGIDIPPWLEDLVMDCLEKDPAMRPGSMEVVGQRLAASEVAAKRASQMIPALTREPASVAIHEAPPRAPPALDSERPVTSTSREEKAERTGPKKTAFSRLLLFAATLGVAAIATSFAFSRGSQQSAGAAAPPPAAAVSTFVLTLESTPAGAEVTEGDRVLGTTPLRVNVDNASAAGHPRRFHLGLNGYMSSELVQGPSPKPVTLRAILAAAANGPSTSVRVPAPAPRQSAAHAHSPTPPTPTPPVESSAAPFPAPSPIRLER